MILNQEEIKNLLPHRKPFLFLDSVEILEIGICHDVTIYYKKAVKIADFQELGDVMINQLTKLFSEKNKMTMH